MALTALTAPVLALAADKPAGADAYVGRVFEKLRAGWETQARTAPLADSNLTFILNPDGSLALTRLSAESAQPLPNTAVQVGTLDFLKQAAPFEPFPASMSTGSLEFQFHFTPDSMRMDSVRLLPRPVIAVTPVVSSTAIASASTTPMPGVAFLALSDRPGRNAGFSLNDLSGIPENQAPPQVTGVLGYSVPGMEGYVADVQARISRNVELPDSYLENLPTHFKPVVAQLLLDRDGGLMSALLTQSSGDKTLDAAILQAIRQSVPFGPVPETAQSLPVQIETTFDPIPLPPSVAEQN